ncbi:hypothetical protein DIPPA_13220 [Diplonema papillatum]|nr:hypothetical protein DIPPA_13220 [Diplonema papillatum]
MFWSRTLCFVIIEVTLTACAQCTTHGTVTKCNDDSAHCEWDCVNEVCHSICRTANYTGCTASPACRWDMITGMCHRARCQYTHEAPCMASGVCEWISESLTCTEHACYGIGNQWQCEVSGVCEWDTSCGFCNNGECTDLYATAQTCTADAAALGCQWSASSCGRATCDDYNGFPDMECRCKLNANCYLNKASTTAKCVDKRYSSCGDFDIAIAVDSSCKMSEATPPQPVMYDAILDTIRDMLRATPLSGDPAGSLSVGGGGSFRFAFSSFADSAAVGVCTECSCDSRQWAINDKSTACGKLSGSRSQLEADLADLHAQGPQAEDCGNVSLTHEVLWAEQVFRDSPPARKRLLILFIASPVDDVADERQKAVRDNLLASGVELFVFYLTKHKDATAGELSVAASLSGIPSKGGTPFVTVDGVRTYLGSFCDEESYFGQYERIFRKCEDAGTDAALCLLQTTCTWRSTSGVRVDDCLLVVG